MPSNNEPLPLDYCSPEPKQSRIPLRWFVTYAALLTAVLYQLAIHAASNSPMHSNGIPPASLLNIHNVIQSTNNALNAVSDGRNVQMHFPTEPRLRDAKLFSLLYFSSQYMMYPRHIFIGSDNRIINNAPTLFAADELPGLPWMQAHNIAVIFTLLPMDASGPHARVHRLPR